MLSSNRIYSLAAAGSICVAEGGAGAAAWLTGVAFFAVFIAIRFTALFFATLFFGTVSRAVFAAAYFFAAGAAFLAAAAFFARTSAHRFFVAAIMCFLPAALSFRFFRAGLAAAFASDLPS